MTHLDWLPALAAALPVSILAAHLAFAAQAGAATEPPDPARVAAVAAMLPERPAAPGRTIADRAAWDRLAADPAMKAVVARAGELLAQPLPEQPDDLYLEYSRNGNRSRFQAVAFGRRKRLAPLVLAECIENKGRFIPAIARLVDALAAERTWVLPAHDGRLNNFNGKTVEIDLFSSAVGWHLAVANGMLGDKLPAATRDTIRRNVERRILAPFRDGLAGTRPRSGWMTVTNNWNAVCLAGVTGAALAQSEPREDRAAFVVAAETYSRNFLAGFTPDGYCSEGLGYWNYGFGHYVMLAETVRQATGGGVDLMARPEVKAPAAFAARIQVIGGVAPAFADCDVGSRPSPTTLWFVNRRFGLGLAGYNTLDLAEGLGALPEAMLYAFPNAATAVEPAADKGPALRDWFQEAGVLICRPATGAASRLGAALKGGHHAEHHNHNDVGSYVVVVSERPGGDGRCTPVLLDPGRETYTARTFSGRRYESKLLNSFGHPVPVVAGKLQETGRKAAARVVRTDFTDKADTLVLDLRAAYAVADCKTLERTFVYSRDGAGGLAVTDRVAFAAPQVFATALITRGRWKRLDAGSIEVTDGKASVRVDIDAGGQAFTVEAEEIVEDAPVRPTRIAISLAQPVTAAAVTLKITPAAP